MRGHAAGRIAGGAQRILRVLVRYRSLLTSMAMLCLASGLGLILAGSSLVKAAVCFGVGLMTGHALLRAWPDERQRNLCTFLAEVLHPGLSFIGLAYVALTGLSDLIISEAD
jgi:hypothetical protein